MQGTIDVQIGSVTTSVLVELLSTDHFASSAGHPDDSSGGQSSDPTVLYTFNVNKYVYLILLVSPFYVVSTYMKSTPKYMDYFLTGGPSSSTKNGL